MFEVGRKYVITTLDDEVGHEVQKWAVYVVEHVDGVLIRAKTADRSIIFNTNSSKFVRAELIANDGEPAR